MFYKLGLSYSPQQQSEGGTIISFSQKRKRRYGNKKQLAQSQTIMKWQESELSLGSQSPEPILDSATLNETQCLLLRTSKSRSSYRPAC